MPVTVSTEEPATAALQDTVVVPEPVIEAGVIAPHVRPDGTVSLKLTAPAKPFTAVTVIADVAEEPALAGAGEDADMVKSWNRNIARAV